ncbi:MAG: hypothetical protein Q4C54_06705 [Clostridia bacterium]|nr:hypothetical protein [Clostridia bacterium]
MCTNKKENMGYTLRALEKAGIILLYSGDGAVEAVTDGEDWYIRQLPFATRNRWKPED